MSGTKEGARRREETIALLYTQEDFKAWGRKGGKAKVDKGFSKMDPEKRKEASKKGLDKRWNKTEEPIDNIA